MNNKISIKEKLISSFPGIKNRILEEELDQIGPGVINEALERIGYKDDIDYIQKREELKQIFKNLRNLSPRDVIKHATTSYLKENYNKLYPKKD